jgi:acyl-lipid omega-6 desaturase (Delta-12 desaturase)
MIAAGCPSDGSRPSVRSVKCAIENVRASRSTIVALWLVASNVAVYVGVLGGVLLCPWWSVRIACSIVSGVSVAILFILAHDACHGGLTPHPALNGLLGRICFLPSLFPYSPWEYGHNRVHHAWTNLKEKDYGWRPLSLEEYRSRSAGRRRLERVYRTTAGVTLYGIIEIWWRHMMTLTDEDRRAIRPLPRRLDRSLVCVYAIAMSASTASFGVSAMLLALLVPWLIFHWLFSIVTLQHHTHPRARWFSSRAEWSFYEGQVCNTVHVVFPRAVELILHNITVHGAHHADPKVPLYGLTRVQTRLEREFGEDMIVERWSLTTHRRLLRTCRLYDYERHQWLDFDGAPTTLPASRPQAAFSDR